MPNSFKGSFLITGLGALIAAALNLFGIEGETKLNNLPGIFGNETFFLGGIGALLISIYLFFLWLDNGSGSYMSPSKEERRKSKDEWLK